MIEAVAPGEMKWHYYYTDRTLFEDRQLHILISETCHIPGLISRPLTSHVVLFRAGNQKLAY